jgi:hypothetical protein
VKKKLLYTNIFLIVAVLFAVCYQSVHSFSHEHHHLNERCAESHHFTFKVSEKTIAESNDCPICDFKFVVFLSPEVIQFDFITSYYEIPYQFNSNESCITADGNSFYLRGPPVLV